MKLERQAVRKVLEKHRAAIITPDGGSDAEQAVVSDLAALTAAKQDSATVEAFFQERLAALSLLAKDKDDPDHEMRKFALGAVVAVKEDLITHLSQGKSK